MKQVLKKDTENKHQMNWGGGRGAGGGGQTNSMWMEMRMQHKCASYGRGASLNPRHQYWKHWEVSFKLQGSWFLLMLQPTKN